MRGDDDEQFVVFLHAGVIAYDLVEAGNCGNRRDSAHRALIVSRDFSSHYGGLAIPQPYAALIFLVGNYRHSIGTLPSQGAHLKFEGQAHLSIAVDNRFRLEAESQVFVTD